jgi:hypothetical protein
MSESEKSQNDLNEFAVALRSLVPLPSAVSRDELMFRAGQAWIERSLATQHSRRWLWPMATAATALVAATLGMLVGQSNSELREPIVQSGSPETNPGAVEVAISPATSSPRPATAYLAERNRILARGVDSLPTKGVDHDDTSSDPSYLELRDRLLRHDRS